MAKKTKLHPVLDEIQTRAEKLAKTVKKRIKKRKVSPRCLRCGATSEWIEY